MNKKILFVTIFLTSIFQLYGQIERQVISTAGNTFYSQNLQLDFTIGQIDFDILNQNQYLFTQGFQQPQIVVTNVATEKIESLSIEVFPNPFSDNINVEINDLHSELSYEIINVSGQNVLKGIATANDNKFSIPSDQINSGIYFFKITDSKHISKCFKIVKSN